MINKKEASKPNNECIIKFNYDGGTQEALRDLVKYHSWISQVPSPVDFVRCTGIGCNCDPSNQI